MTLPANFPPAAPVHSRPFDPAPRRRHPLQGSSPAHGERRASEPARAGSPRPSSSITAFHRAHHGEPQLCKHLRTHQPRRPAYIISSMPPIPPMPPMPPPMPPIPPPGPPMGAPASLGFSTTMQSVRQQQDGDFGGVLQRGALDLGRGDDPGLHHVHVLAGQGVEPFVLAAFHDAADDDAAGGCRQFSAICRNGAVSAWRMIFTPDASSPFQTQVRAVQRLHGADHGPTPPPGTTPSSTAARVACRASSMRAFFSFSSASVAAPTLI